MKNCDRGLENAAAEGSIFKADPKPVNNLFIYFLPKKRFQFL